MLTETAKALNLDLVCRSILSDMTVDLFSLVFQGWKKIASDESNDMYNN